MTDAWMVAVSNTNCERRATQGLEAAGFEVWWPMRLVCSINRYTKRPVETLVPLYRGYLFVRLGSAVEWQAMFGIDGVRTVLLNCQCPVTISEAVMQGVRNDAETIASAKLDDVMEVGDEVRIVNGPFAGLTASLTRIVGLSAVEVAIRMFGGSAPLKIDPGNLEKV